jgi:sulfur relay (sulfurtransferase) DsrC/TusE family protein
MKILEKIKETTFYDSLMTMTLNDMRDITNFYGVKWYTFFFNKYHIRHMIDTVMKNKKILSELKDKYGEQWITEHIVDAPRQLPQHAYDFIIKRGLVQHELRTHKTSEYVPEDTSDYYVNTSREFVSANTELSDMKHQGTDVVASDSESSISTPESDVLGSESESSDIYKSRFTNSDDLSVSDSTKTDVKQSQSILSGGDDESIESIDETDEGEYGTDDIESTQEINDSYEEELEDIEQLYNAEDSVNKKDTEKAVSLIQKVLNSDDIMKKKESKMIKFDVSKDTNIYAELLTDVFVKNYVTEQYIFKDDTIKVIKNKIFCSIKNNPRFGKKNYLLPSRQYLWSEYFYNDKIQKVMLGLKWLQKNELLKIDIEPFDNIKVYTELRGSIKTLRDDLRRVNSKIRKDDDDNNILFDYEGYFDNNEIFLIDVYNEIGLHNFLTADAITNLTDTYLRIYFPRISQPNIRHIIDYINDNQSVEKDTIERNYESINTDLLLENEVVNVVEKVKRDEKYTYIMKENYITQSMINVMLNSKDIENFKRIDMFQIFDDFIPSETYPFLQYMAPDGSVLFKLNEEEMNKYKQDKDISNVIGMWFQNVTTGLSFKIKADKINSSGFRFMTVNLSDLGKLDYKIQWKIEDHAVVDDIAITYDVIRSLIKEINTSSIKHKFDLPENKDFKTAFITTIQHYELEKDYTIDHNELSQFARYFFPYFALVIDPKKRVSKVHENELVSKYGTYLRYKRISKYEDVTKIEQRIMYFVRNYEYTDKLIIDEISKQFNITLEKAAEHLKNTLQKWPKIRKARHELKKFTGDIKYKSPGIDASLQGKTRDKYNIRISGARDKQQLNRIITALNVLIYLYADIYLAKKQKWQYLKDKLKKLNNIAERRHIVSDFVKYSAEKMNIKAMAETDKRRIGYKPEKGQSHYTRVCQNSGTQQRRRPQQFTATNIEEMIKSGYSFNKATGMYERRIMTKENGKTVSKILRAVKLNTYDESGNPEGNEVYYTCSPDKNGIHAYVGFLSRSKNPNGEYMPCCFKKDQYTSDNEEKRTLFMKGIGQMSEDTDQPKVSFSDQLYILQDTNKIQPDRFGFLPKLLNAYLNDAIGLKRVYVQHNLISAPEGYFFKYGIKHEPNSFLSAIANTLDISIDNLISKLINALNKDKDDILFTSLNNGDIRTKFRTRNSYIKYLKDIENIDFSMVEHLICTPNIINNFGLNIVTFLRVSKKDFDGVAHDDCVLVCNNSEEVTNITEPHRDTILLYLENDNYYPIFNVTKKSKNDKSIEIQKTYKYTNEHTNIVNHIKEFYQNNCVEKTIRSIINKESILLAKTLYKKLVEHKNSDYTPISQYIDKQNKCHYIITQKNILIPVTISGSIYNLPIISDISQYVDTYANTITKLTHIYNEFDGKIPVRPISVNYDKKTDTAISVKNIIVQTGMHVPVKSEQIPIKKIESDNLTIETTPAYDMIDTELSQMGDSISDIQLHGSEIQKSSKIVPGTDERVKSVSYEKYVAETYNLFRYTLSDYINKQEMTKVREKLIKIISSHDRKQLKVLNIKTILYKLIDDDLLQLHLKVANEVTNVSEESAQSFESLNADDLSMTSDEQSEDEKSDELEKISDMVSEPNIEQSGGKAKFIHIIDQLPNVDGYMVKNIRTTCDTKPKQTCSLDPQCSWDRGGCIFSLTRKLIIMYVNRVSAELADNGVNAYELLHIDDYSVSRVVNKNYFAERKNQKIIKSTSDNVLQAINLFFGKADTVKFGKNRKLPTNQDDIEQLQHENPLKDFGNKFIQVIIPNNNTLLRAYANAYHWNENPYSDISVRNIGYYGQVQTDIMIYLKSLIIDWFLDQHNNNVATKLLAQYTKEKTINSYIIKLASNVSNIFDGTLELYVLNKIQHIPIIIYEGDVITKVFDGEIFTDNLGKYSKTQKAINLQFDYSDDTNSSSSIGVIYFK